MDLIVYEQNRTYVLERFRNGEFDYVDLTTEIAETRFFKFLLNKEIIQHLGATYPTPREKEEVPVWIAVISNLSLRYHNCQSFYSYPYMVRLGGLLDALNPEIGERKMDPDKRTIEIRCKGFNKKNHYSRKTPCDQDFLRKLAKDTDSEALINWYNKEIIWCVNNTIGFDEEGIFVGDASYIFVPDNERYEGSVVLLFDEHNHPVDSSNIDAKDIKAGKYKWRRCYQFVSIIHTNRRKDYFPIVSLKVINGKEHPVRSLYELVDNFVKIAGKGVMKKLILDRGFIDGAKISKCKKEQGIDIVIGVRKNMDVYADAMGLAKEVKWEEYSPKREQETLRILPQALAKREAKRQETIKRLKEEKEKNSFQEVKIKKTLIAGIKDFESWESCSVPIHIAISKDIYTDGTEKTWMIATTERFEEAKDAREDYKIREVIEERHRQLKCFNDLTKFPSRSYSLVVHQVVMTMLTYSLLQMRVYAEFRGELNKMTLPMLRRNMEPKADKVVIYNKQYFAFLTIHEYSEILLTLEEFAREKILKKTRQLQRNIIDFEYSPRDP